MRRAITMLLVLTMIFIAGCSVGALPDTYIKDSDYQYTQWSSGIFFPNVQQGDGVAFFYSDGFLYYLEDGKNVILPLCNKVDCLHDKEPDTEKKIGCNAFLDAFMTSAYAQSYEVGIAKSNGYLYSLNAGGIPGSRQSLIRCALDGTKKETVYTWGADETVILEWCIHRDVLYYVEKRYYLEDEELIEESSVKALPLTGLGRQPVNLYTAEQDLSVLSLGAVCAYGNYVYFDIIARRNDVSDMAAAEDPYARLYEKTFVYDIRNDSLSELSIPGLPGSAVILGVRFWQDKILIEPYDNSKEGNAPMPVYIAELDGSDPEVLFKDVPQSGYFLSDGEYLYFFDNWMPDIDDWLSNPGLYTVYDKNLNIADTFTVPLMPNGSYASLPVGGEDWMYYIYEDKANGTWSIVRWEKNRIGSYDGKEVEIEFISR